MTDKTYEDFVNECAVTRQDLDTVLHPTFGHLKKAFTVLFQDEDWTKSDFKKLSDMVYYQGGYPSPNSPAKEVALADQVNTILRLESYVDRGVFKKHLKERGITVTFDVDSNPAYNLSVEDDRDLREAWAGAGLDSEVPDNRHDALKLLVDRAQELQSEICQQADTIKIDAADEVESTFKIQKPNFVKAVGLAALKLRRGAGVQAEKIDVLDDAIANLEAAIAPLRTNASQ